MKRSTDRILVTHVGSLVRPPAIRDVMWARERERAYDEAVFEKTLKDEVAAVVRQQAATGIDVVSDGEFGKAGWVRYVAERLGGFVHREFREGDHEATANHLIPEVAQFAEFYAAYHPIQYYDWLPPGQSKTPLKPDDTTARPKALVWDCVAPITYKGQAAIKRDIENFDAALAGVKVEGAFMPVAAPMSARGLWLNTYYKNDAEVVVALADALKAEYQAIVDGGFILQLDDAFMAHEYARLLGEMSRRDVHKYAESCVELTNHALNGIPEDKVRYHVCWGSWNVPHVQDVPLKTIVDLVLKVRAQAYSIEAANPRHAHEFQVWKDVKLPDGKILIPGVISHATNVVEHPELVALRLKNFAHLVGRENVIAGTDCGFSQSYDIIRCHPSVQWAKLEALVEGARLASNELWGRRGLKRVRFA